MATTKKTVQEKPAAPEKTATSKKTPDITKPPAKAATKKKEAATAVEVPELSTEKESAVMKTAGSRTKSKTTDENNPPAEETVIQPSVKLPSSSDKWGEIRTILLNMKKQTLLEINRSIKNGSELSIGEEPTGDIYDQASSERDRELGLLLNDRERQKLHNIDEALLRIDEGEYGICEECDEDIPIGRLKVLPFTRHCVKCKSDIEKFQAQTRRIEEDRAYREIPVTEDDEG